MRTPASTSAGTHDAMNSGVSGYTSAPAFISGSPALAWMASGSSVCARMSRAISSIASMPLPQFDPTTSAPAAESPATACATLTPITVKNPRRVRSNVIVAITGSAGATRLAASTASRASVRSVIVSTTMRSAPAPASAVTCRAKPSPISAGSPSPYGFSTSPHGPTDPATIARSPAARRVASTAARLMASVRSSRW